MAILKRVTGEPAGQIIELKNDRVVIGRAPDCHIILDPNGVSRHHAEIRRDGESYLLADLRSRNKTKLNNVDMTPGRDHRLKPGDRINICDVEMVYFDVPPKPKPPGSLSGSNLVIVTDGGSDSHILTLDASRSSSLASAVRPEVKLKAILEITRNLSTELQIDAVAPKILDSLMQLFPQAERLFLLLRDRETTRLERKAFRYRPTQRSGLNQAPADEPPTSISRSLVEHVLVQKKAVLSQDAGNDIDLPTTASIADLKIRSVMCVPLLTPDGEASGIIQLDTSNRKQFQQEDLDVLAAVASQAAIAIQNAALHETLLARERLSGDLKIAEQVQKRLVPQSVPEIDGYEFFSYYNPAYEVGGDYYDFVTLPQDRLAIAVGDVSGKGVAAALMMAKYSGDTRYCILVENSPAAAASELNSLLFGAGIEEKFITLSLSVLDLPRRHLTLCSAGHPLLIVRRVDGRVEEVGGDIVGFPLGVMPDSSYQQIEVALTPGDVVVAYSDGVTDACSPRGELYDSHNNRRLLKRVAESPGGPKAVGRAILQEIREFSAGQPQSDDMTLLCFGVTAGSR